MAINIKIPFLLIISVQMNNWNVLIHKSKIKEENKDIFEVVFGKQYLLICKLVVNYAHLRPST